MLFSVGADPNLKTKEVDNELEKTSFHYICENDNVNTEKIQLFVENKGDVNSLDRNGSTPLHLACKNPYFHFDSIEILFQFNANPNIKDHNDESPIDIAKKNSRYDICSLFFSKN